MFTGPGDRNLSLKGIKRVCLEESEFETLLMFLFQQKVSQADGTPFSGTSCWPGLRGGLLT